MSQSALENISDATPKVSVALHQPPTHTGPGHTERNRWGLLPSGGATTSGGYYHLVVLLAS